ncbi:MAG TPA: hypothetical protein VF472_07285 [Burkholderiaceae bacterium]
MTTPTNREYPKPKDWQHFERLCTAIFGELCDTNFQPHGRSGYRQNGVDSVGTVKKKEIYALQCKGRSSGIGKPLTTGQVDKAILEAETFPVPIAEFFILTTASIDIKMNNHVLVLNAQRAKAGKFPVTVWGWQTLEEKIALCPRVQRNFFGSRWQRPSFLYPAGIIAVAAAAAALVWIGVPQFQGKLAAGEKVRHNSVEGLDKLSDSVTQLQQAYDTCLTAFNKTTFMFTPELKKSCTGLLEPKLEAMERMRDKFASSMDEKSFSEVSTLIQIMREDFRQLMITQDMTGFFENEYVRHLSQLCYAKEKKPGADSIFATVPKEGAPALNSQMQTYFTMRDFIAPGLRSIKARLAILSRTIEDQAAPAELVAQANSLNAILAESHAYSYHPTATPLVISQFKANATRDIKEGDTKFLDYKEQLLWQEIAAQALTESLRGRKDDVENLISCGVLSDKARELYQQDELTTASVQR